MNFPFRPIHFDAGGALLNDSPAGFVSWISSAGITDLFVFSHGWNNDEATAMGLFNAFFGSMNAILSRPGVVRKRSDAVIGAVGVVWPSIVWPDETPSTSGGGAATLAHAGAHMDLFSALSRVFVLPEQQAILGDLNSLLDARPNSDAALKQFKAGLRRLLAAAPESAPHDSLEKMGVETSDDQYRELFDALADNETASDSPGGAAGLGDRFGRLWNGAKGALRAASYYQMKSRAGLVGEQGLGPLLSNTNARIYLLGHSFGARLVSYSLKPIPSGKVKMLYLLQGAFSHFAFARSLPFDQTRSGDLAGIDRKVDGPLLVTHTLKDLAVGVAYPLASVVARQDASAAVDPGYRWGAMGHDGAQGVDAIAIPLDAPPERLVFTPGRWHNLDANRVIVNGGPPSGAHSDIIHRETAWVALAGAGIV